MTPEKLKVDAQSIAVTARDFMMSLKSKHKFFALSSGGIVDLSRYDSVF